MKQQYAVGDLVWVNTAGHDFSRTQTVFGMARERRGPPIWEAGTVLTWYPAFAMYRVRVEHTGHIVQVYPQYLHPREPGEERPPET